MQNRNLLFCLFFICGAMISSAQSNMSKDSAGSGIKCGHSTVDYSGKIYNTVQIGTQCWLKENLDAGTMVTMTADTNSSILIKKYCYQNKPENCAIYGGLYQWKGAMRNSTEEKTRGICPEGWHIPAKAEFEVLKAFTMDNSNLLKAAADSTESGSTGFTALLAGYRGYFSGTCASLGNCALYWTSTELDNDSAFNLYLTADNNKISFDDNYKINAFSVRCVKNE